MQYVANGILLYNVRLYWLSVLILFSLSFQTFLLHNTYFKRLLSLIKNSPNTSSSFFYNDLCSTCICSLSQLLNNTVDLRALLLLAFLQHIFSECLFSWHSYCLKVCVKSPIYTWLCTILLNMWAAAREIVPLLWEIFHLIFLHPPPMNSIPLSTVTRKLVWARQYATYRSSSGSMYTLLYLLLSPVGSQWSWSFTGKSWFHIRTPLGIWTRVPCDRKQSGGPLDQWDMVNMQWDYRLSTRPPILNLMVVFYS